MEPRYDQPRFQAVVDQFGEPESRRLLSTPALVCDHDLLVENVARMATKTALAGTNLRPHVKSHKSAYVARLQLEAGASGLAFAKLSEAEAVTARLRSGDPQRGTTTSNYSESPIDGESTVELWYLFTIDTDLAKDSPMGSASSIASRRVMDVV